MGIILAIGAAVCMSIAGTCVKYFGKHYHPLTSLVMQYIAFTLVAILVFIIGSQIEGYMLFSGFTSQTYLLLAITGIIGFLGIYFLYRASQGMPIGVVLVIALSNVIMRYGINISLFGQDEAFSVAKIILGIAFFVVVTCFLLKKGEGFKLNRYALFAIGTALCWATYFSVSTWFTKTGGFHPLQTSFFTETSILPVAIIGFLIWGNKQPITLRKKSDFWIYTLMGTSGIGAAACTYYAYTFADANTVNIIILFQIFITSFLAKAFLNDTLSRRQVALMTIGLIVLGGFMAVDMFM